MTKVTSIPYKVSLAHKLYSIFENFANINIVFSGCFIVLCAVFISQFYSFVALYTRMLDIAFVTNYNYLYII